MWTRINGAVLHVIKKKKKRNKLFILPSSGTEVYFHFCHRSWIWTVEPERKLQLSVLIFDLQGNPINHIMVHGVQLPGDKAELEQGSPNTCLGVGHDSRALSWWRICWLHYDAIFGEMSFLKFREIYKGGVSYSGTVARGWLSQSL